MQQLALSSLGIRRTGQANYHTNLLEVATTHIGQMITIWENPGGKESSFSAPFAQKKNLKPTIIDSFPLKPY